MQSLKPCSYITIRYSTPRTSIFKSKFLNFFNKLEQQIKENFYKNLPENSNNVNFDFDDLFFANIK